jgi:hypothetical protein
MTDSEMLILAKRAAGYTDLEFGGAGPYWNSLEDEGDALRLAIKVDIEFYRVNNHGWATYAGYWSKQGNTEVRRYVIEHDEGWDNKGNPNSSTKRAITRAAAQWQKEQE